MRASSLLVTTTALLFWHAPGEARHPCDAFRPRGQKPLLVYLKRAQRLCLFRGGRLVFAERASHGGVEGKKRFQGDRKTPEGLYRLAPARHSKRYGRFMFISYPSAADRNYARKRGRKPGFAVGIHGPPRWGTWLGGIPALFNLTDGCILLSETNMQRLSRLVQRPTPIRIVPGSHP